MKKEEGNRQQQRDEEVKGEEKDERSANTFGPVKDCLIFKNWGHFEKGWVLLLAIWHPLTNTREEEKKDDGGDEEEKEEEEDEIDANTFWPSQRRPCQASGKAWFCRDPQCPRLNLNKMS